MQHYKKITLLQFFFFLGGGGYTPLVYAPEHLVSDSQENH